MLRIMIISTIIGFMAFFSRILLFHWVWIPGISLLSMLLSAIVSKRTGYAAKEDAELRDYAANRGVRSIIIGAGHVGRTLAENLEKSGKYHVLGFIENDASLKPDGWEILGDKSSAMDIIKEMEVEEVFVAYSPTWQHHLMEDLVVEASHVGIRVVPSEYEAMLSASRTENVGDLAVIRLNEMDVRLWDVVKRIWDILFSIIALSVGFPFMLLIAVAIKLNSRGPVFFFQERVGRGGVVFRIIKFRTMVHNAESSTGAILSIGKSDPRVTSTGRILRALRLDEIPQFWNILKGEMSLVGPRPERPVFVERYVKENPLYSKRHDILPGITGLAQVCGGYDTDARDKLRFDLIYIANRSLWMDLKILLKTVQVVFGSKGS